jgi:hypothetical protein
MGSTVDLKTNDSRDVLRAISIDNTMAQDALRQKNYQALQAALERQNKEIKKLVEILYG